MEKRTVWWNLKGHPYFYTQSKATSHLQNSTCSQRTEAFYRFRLKSSFTESNRTVCQNEQATAFRPDPSIKPFVKLLWFKMHGPVPMYIFSEDGSFDCLLPLPQATSKVSSTSHSVSLLIYSMLLYLWIVYLERHPLVCKLYILWEKVLGWDNGKKALTGRWDFCISGARSSH